MFNTRCYDCKTNNSTHINITFGTFHCAECSFLHRLEFSVVKGLDEVFDLYQLNVIEHGGNQAFRTFLDQYEKEKEKTFPLLYRCDAAIYYSKVLNFKIKGVEFTERAPPKNEIEQAQFAAQDTGKVLNSGFVATEDYIKKQNEQYKITQQAGEQIKKIDDQYNISKTASDAAAKTKSAIMGGFGLFSKKKPDEPPTTNQ